MREVKPIFDLTKAKERIDKGKLAKWWQRKGSKSRGFKYIDASGKNIGTKEDLERIASLVIPPAWKYVRISPSAGSRLQAVGVDTVGRVQYLYHQKFSERQQRRKFSKIEKFGEHLPQLRRITNEHIALEGFPRDKVLAIMMRLINSLYFRVGTNESVRHYKTYGITTLQNRHLKIGKKGKLEFDFVGKSHIRHRRVLVDEDLANEMKHLRELGGARKLFHYLDEAGKAVVVSPRDINDYLKAATAPEFSAKDFRTWGGTLLAAIELAEIGKGEDERQIKTNIVKAVKKVAAELGNTPSVCRSSYIHPAILKAYEKGVTLDEFRPAKQRPIKKIESEYEPEEKALLKLLQDKVGDW